MLVTAAVIIGLLVLALVPLLLHQTGLPPNRVVADLIRLVPLVPPPVVKPPEPKVESLPEPEPEPEIPEQVLELPETVLPLIDPPDLEPPALEPPSPALTRLKWDISLSSLPVQSTPIDSKMKLKLTPAAVSAPKTARPVPAAPFAYRRFNLDEVDKKPQGLSTMPPIYPYKARRLAMEGYVKVIFLVNRKGTVSDLTILEAEPKDVFEQSVKKTLPKWRFKPAQKDGRPVDAWIKTTIEFILEADS